MPKSEKRAFYQVYSIWYHKKIISKKKYPILKNDNFILLWLTNKSHIII